nr:chemotaxis protein CheW [uncultured Rhodoferax sp.]
MEATSAVVPGVNGSEGQDVPALQCLTFSIADELVAIDIRNVREIIQHASVAPVPMMPEFIRGVINLRGSVVPVIDMMSRFGMGRTPIAKRTSIIIYHSESQGENVELGLLVGAVSEVMDVSQRDIDDVPSFGTTVRRDYVRNLGRINDRFVPILDCDRALNMDNMAELVAKAHGVN